MRQHHRTRHPRPLGTHVEVGTQVSVNCALHVALGDSAGKGSRAGRNRPHRLSARVEPSTRTVGQPAGRTRLIASSNIRPGKNFRRATKQPAVNLNATARKHLVAQATLCVRLVRTEPCGEGADSPDRIFAQRDQADLDSRASKRADVRTVVQQRPIRAQTLNANQPAPVGCRLPICRTNDRATQVSEADHQPPATRPAAYFSSPWPAQPPLGRHPAHDSPISTRASTRGVLFKRGSLMYPTRCQLLPAE